MHKRILKIGGLLAVAAVVLTACAPESTPAVVTQLVGGTPQVITVTPEPTENPYDENAPITVWIDQDRQPYIDAYKKANPDKASLIQESIVDREQFPSKVLLFNNTGEGWPDVVFGEPRFVGRVADAAHDFPLDLKPWISEDILNNYDGMAGCTFGDKILCVRNDLAQYVLYYNKPLMDQFGYQVPETWEDYQALSDKVAAEHPGYLLGTLGDGWSWLSFFDPSSCPSHLLVDDNTFQVNMADPKCLRAAKLVDHMIANKTLWDTDYFDATFVQQQNDNKVLMIAMASWAWGVFNGTYYLTPDHQLGVAAPLKWADEDAPVNVAQGGAGWMVSRHTTNPKLATELVVWLTTNEGLWATIPNFPAYRPIQSLFQKQVSSNAIFANDPFQAMQAAASYLGPLDKWPRFDMISPLTQVVKGAYQDKVTMESVLSQVLDKFKPLAETEGYLVVTQ
jgi:ABC-type glycerol-3-phosphate transport system substrate-binding protein